MVTSLDLDVLQPAMDANLAGYWLPYGCGAGGILQRTGAAAWFYSGIPHPLFNGVPAPFLSEAEIDPFVEGLQSAIDRSGASAYWWVSPRATPVGLAPVLAARHVNHAGDVPGMAMDLAMLAPEAAMVPGLTITLADDARQRAVWARIAALGTGFADAAVNALEALEPTIDSDEYQTQRRYLGLVNGVPVATSALVVAGGVAGVYAVATLPDARRRGLGRAMTVRPLLDARDAGYGVGILQASPMGYPIYRRLGFNDACVYRLHLQTPRGTAAPGS